MSTTAADLLGPAEIRQLAAKLGVTPTKKLGQNFVHDPNTVRRIIAAADISSGDHVVEIGPGLGSLTLGLLDTAGAVTAVEIDKRLAAELPATAQWRAPAVADRLSVVTQDAMQVTAEDVAAPTALVANLPYNVSVPVLLHFLAVFPTIERVLVMVQAEVADRLAAEPGSKIYGVPSVKASFYGRSSGPAPSAVTSSGRSPTSSPGWCASIATPRTSGPGRRTRRPGKRSFPSSTRPSRSAAKPCAPPSADTTVRPPRRKRR